MNSLTSTTSGVLFLHVYDGPVLKTQIRIGRMYHDHDDVWRIVVEDLTAGVEIEYDAQDAVKEAL